MELITSRRYIDQTVSRDNTSHDESKQSETCLPKAGIPNGTFFSLLNGSRNRNDVASVGTLSSDSQARSGDNVYSSSKRVCALLYSSASSLILIRSALLRSYSLCFSALNACHHIALSL